MSMSQEEIEALMNGLDIAETEETEAAEDEVDLGQSVSEDDINKLISETQAVEDKTTVSDDDIDSLVNSFEEDSEEIHEALDEDVTVSVEDVNTTSDTDIDDLLSSLEEDSHVDNPIEDLEEETTSEEIEASLDTESEEVKEEVIEEFTEVPSLNPDYAEKDEENSLTTDDDIDALLSSIDKEKEEPESLSGAVKQNETIGKSWADNKIEEGIFPMPVESNHKVVKELSEVANDSEEKATMVFDIFSEILDNNSVSQKQINEISLFITKQNELLEKLNAKFPNIAEFKENLESAKKIQTLPSSMLEEVDIENEQIFKAMELMQFHDIHRQKIERVMSVIRKLSRYLGNLFDDEGSPDTTPVASHISGDSTTDLMEDDDLDALIKEFGK